MRSETERAVIGRINRHLLREQGVSVKRSRYDSRWYGELGRYYIVDGSRNVVVARHVDIHHLARELDAVGAREAMAE